MLFWGFTLVASFPTLIVCHRQELLGTYLQLLSLGIKPRWLHADVSCHLFVVFCVACEGTSTICFPPEIFGKHVYSSVISGPLLLVWKWEVQEGGADQRVKYRKTGSFASFPTLRGPGDEKSKSCNTTWFIKILHATCNSQWRFWPKSPSSVRIRSYWQTWLV